MLYHLVAHARDRRDDRTGPAGTSRRPGTTRTVARAVLAIVGAAVLGVAAILATALLTAEPALFLGAGLLVFTAVAAAGACWVLRGVRGWRRRRVLACSMTAAALAVLGGLGLPAAVPGGDVGRPVAVPGERFWQLPTGTRARYVHVPARRTPRPTPVVLLHGGPGTPDLAGDAAFVGRLADDGFDVYAYDQVGAGGSTRLADPRQYGLARDVADLEAVRMAIGADRMVLIGHSYGARIVAGYHAAHPGRVARAVFLSPASLDPADPSGAGVRGRLTRGQQARLYARLLGPRNLLVYGLLQVRPEAAHALGGDGEMDARNDQVYALGEPGLHCRGHADPDPPTGLGFYRLQYPQSATAPRDPDLRPALAGDPTPTLVVKGSCDYLTWSSAVTYLDTFRDSRLVYLRAGHNVHQDAPEVLLATLRAFLTGRSLPVPPRGPSMPGDYEGPP